MSSGTRRLFYDLVVISFCLWTGYFLVRQRADFLEMRFIFVLAGSVLAYIGVDRALADGRRRALGFVLYLAGTALALPGGMAAAVAPVLPLAGLLRRRGAGRPVAVRFLLGCLFAALALAAGWLTTFSISQSAAGSIALLACTVGLIDVLRSTRPVGKGAFLAVAAAVIVILVFVAAVGSTAPRGLVVVVLCGYAAIRVIWYGRHVLERCDAERQQAFAETALVGAILLAAALLVFHAPADRRSMSELAPPLVLGAAAIILTRTAQFLPKEDKGV